MVLTVTSMVGMPILGIAKQRMAETLGSCATHGEGAQNLLCAYLAGAVVLGLAATRCWVGGGSTDRRPADRGGDVGQGVQTWRGEDCCAPSPAAGFLSAREAPRP
jgi:hypothetical protein